MLHIKIRRKRKLCSSIVVIVEIDGANADLNFAAAESVCSDSCICIEKVAS